MKKSTWMYIAAGILIAVLIVLAILKNKNGHADHEVTTEKAMRRAIDELVTATGQIQPVMEVKISPEVSGEIIILSVEEGQKVNEGDHLVTINPDLFESIVNRAEASMNSSRANVANSKARLEQSKARLINAEAEYQRQKELFEDKVISQSDMDRATSEYEVTKSEVLAAEESLKGAEYNAKSAQASVTEARDNLKRTTIYSPSDGVVSMLNVEKGERVVGTAQMAGTELMRIADLKEMEVNVEVNESDIVKVKIGQSADIEVDAYRDRKFRGTVTEIANSSSSSLLQGSNDITVFNVMVLIDRNSYTDLVDAENPHLSPFRPGMSATVDIETNSRSDVITVPIQSVTLRPDSLIEGESRSRRSISFDDYEDDELSEVVFIREGDQAVKKKVKTGIQNTRYIEILEGLEEGEEVVSGPYSIVSKKLMDGDEIKIKENRDE